MSQTRDQFAQVMVMCSEYNRHIKTGFTVNMLYEFIEDYGDYENSIKKRTLKRCLDDLAGVPDDENEEEKEVYEQFIKRIELPNRYLYEVHEPALLPQPAEIIGSSENAVEFTFSGD